MSGANTKRAWKLQEFVAHGANVNCLALGHKSGRVLVTGGDDKKVNLWAVGKPNCIMVRTFGNKKKCLISDIPHTTTNSFKRKSFSMQ